MHGFRTTEYIFIYLYCGTRSSKSTMRSQGWHCSMQVFPEVIRSQQFPGLDLLVCTVQKAIIELLKSNLKFQVAT